MKQNIIDHAEFFVKAGDGGDGIVSFRREKYIPKGGPDGGDGGAGGSVWFVAEENVKDLRDFAGVDRFEGNPGRRGGQKLMRGANAEDISIVVPVGTEVWVRDGGYVLLAGHQLYGDFGYIPIPVRLMPIIKSQNFEERWPGAVSVGAWVKVGDLDTPGQKLLIAQGGAGGRGNTRYKSSRLTTPKFAERGEKAEEWQVKLELKVLADVGLVGLPNVGKSTLLSVLTAAKPEIANYPFTTLTPNLGVMEGKENLVIADIPGLIEDAHVGKGLGTDFLKHIERCKALVYVVAPPDELLLDDSSDWFMALWEQYQIVRNEAQAYSSDLVTKPSLLVVNKGDLVGSKRASIVDAFSEKGIDVVMVSAATGEGIEELKKVVGKMANLEMA